MEENNNLPIENGMSVESDVVDAVSTDDWDDIDFSDVADNEEGDEDEDKADEPAAKAEEADAKPETKAEEPAADTEKPQEESAKADQPFELKHLGEIKQVNRDEVIALAQKGLNYDHIRAERDAAKQRTGELEAFLKELAEPQGQSIEDLIDTVRAKTLARKENLDESIALQKIKFEREKREFEASKQKEVAEQREKDIEAERRQKAFVRFAKVHADVDPKAIPKEVWEEFNSGNDLSDAYTRFENKQLRSDLKALQAKLDAAEQNAKNREKSTGSQKSAGKGNEMDAFERAWYNGE